MVLRPQPWRAVVPAASRDRHTMESVDLGSARGRYGDVHRTVETAFAADPEIGLAICAKSGGRTVILVLPHFDDELVAKRRERADIECFGARVIRYREADVIDHRTRPALDDVADVIEMSLPLSKLVTARSASDDYTCRSTIIRLISAMAFAGLRCLGQALAQFMMVWQR
jgi:hypothetical protein